MNSKKFTVNTEISINMLIACLTLVGAAWGIMDKISANAATTAVIQNKQATTDQQIQQMNTQRFIDRQELLAELRDIKAEIKLNQKVH